jgi:hypothetical protein
LFLIVQSQNLKSIRQVKKKLTDLRKVIREILAKYKKICEIKTQDFVLTAVVV